MTTIAYHHETKTVAVDSRQTMNGRVVTDSANKIKSEDGVRFAFTGKACDEGLFIDYYFSRQKSSLLPEASAIVFDDGVAYSVTVNEDGNVDMFELTMNFTIGSGGDFALAAMDNGKSAKEAVKYAATRCIYTGGRIREIKL